MAISFIPFTSGFGARVDFDPSRIPNADEARDIAAIFNEHLFVYFPRAEMTPGQVADFVTAFGDPDGPEGRLASATEYAGIRIVENVERNKFGPRSNSELDWHSDRFYDPVVAGLLQSVIVPAEGGDTSLANMVQALAELPVDLRRAIEGRTIKQDVVFDERGRPGIRPGGARVDDVAGTPGVSLPIVQTHGRSGQSFLYLGNRLNAYVDGLAVEESDELLDRLYAHVNRMRFLYRHRWAPNELLMYDNRRCMHRREAFEPDAERRLIAAVVNTSPLL